MIELISDLYSAGSPSPYSHWNTATSKCEHGCNDLFCCSTKVHSGKLSTALTMVSPMLQANATASQFLSPAEKNSNSFTSLRIIMTITNVKGLLLLLPRSYLRKHFSQHHTEQLPHPSLLYTITNKSKVSPIFHDDASRF